LDFLTGVVHPNFERVCWVWVFITMNCSDGVSILDLEASFDSGVGGGDAGGYNSTPKSFDLSKIRSKSLKIRKKSSKIWEQMFRHLCSHCVMNETDC